MNTASKSNILLIIPEYGYGGAQRVFSDLANALSADYNVIKVVFNRSRSEVYDSEGETVSIGVSAGYNIVTKAIKFLTRCWKLHRLKRKYNPKCTISHLEGANYVNILSFGPGAKILCVHGSKLAYDSNRKGIINLIERRILTPLLYRSATRIISVSKGIKNELTQSYGIKGKLISTFYNGVDIEGLVDLSRQPLSNEELALFNKPTILFCGRLEPQKNPIALIEIYANLKRKDEINLVILGDGSLKNIMIDRCESYNLNYHDGLNNGNSQVGGIYFLGFCANPFNLMSRATLFILTSDFEGFPLSLCEALALGIPIISTDCATGTREILAPATDFKIYTKTPEQSRYGILMPLVTNLNSVKTWAGEISSRIFDKNWLHTTQTLAKERATALSLTNFTENWLQVISELE